MDIGIPPAAGGELNTVTSGGLVFGSKLVLGMVGNRGGRHNGGPGEEGTEGAIGRTSAGVTGTGAREVWE
jgi:hypothetical protein